VGLVIAGAAAWPAIRMALRQSPLGSVVSPWDGKTTLECGGNDEMTFEDRKATLGGTAVIASGNCHLRLKRCTIVADVAIEAGGNARVTVEEGSIEGKRLAVEAGGNAVVEVRGGMTGKVKRSGNARVNK
jgi:hypothetical protein